MTSGFRARGGTVQATFAAEEVYVLRGLIGELIELIRDDQPAPQSPSGDDSLAALVGAMGPTEPPQDAVLARLFPNAYQDDEEAAAEFRRYTEHGLRDAKVKNAETVLETLGDPSFSDQVTVSLNHDETQAWLRTLTDLRLALGTRLGVQQDDDEYWASLPEEDRRRQIYGVYVWLGWLQESLVTAIW
ncbi:DUF2017 domain-containing protein [Thermasporomyces composti]|jgi:hypothetical protein|uniref:Uncharacterized protein DUF2017 n=1 Tax=Thermasporomyces composti TaxID=696763 RepID=A0A3D9V8M4_THECX|nr:DUF2017 domain-containing protein [Thermasporomyces composti]REF37646.1 uncharacterized protein DUF2017 [Thermasporomyces composti]